jgi:polyisoprenoid-binding protein YceI
MVDTNSLAMKEKFVKNILKSETFLDTETYSKILFVSSELKWLDDENAILKGMLTMHGVTRPVTFDIKINMVPGKEPGQATTIIATASSFIKRKDFNMHNLTFLVDNTVELCMRVEATLFKNKP